MGVWDEIREGSRERWRDGIDASNLVAGNWNETSMNEMDEMENLRIAQISSTPESIPPPNIPIY